MSHFKPVLKQFGLTEQQWRVIRVLAACGQLEASDLARRSMLLAPSLTRILQYLQRESLIIRKVHKNDQRRVLLRLSPEGERLFVEVAPEAEAVYARMEESFGRRRMEKLYELLADFYRSELK